jgi:Divergent InlB B-repeat domain
MSRNGPLRAPGVVATGERRAPVKGHTVVPAGVLPSRGSRRRFLLARPIEDKPGAAGVDVVSAAGGGNPRWALALGALCAVAMVLAGASSALGAEPIFGGTFDGTGTPAGSMTPGRVAVNQVTGDVYVIDSANDVVNRFDRDGAYLSQIPGSSTTAGSFSFGGDADIAIDNSGGTGQGRIYVNNASTYFAFRADGSFDWQRGSGAESCGVAVDDNGRLFGGEYGGGIQERSATDGSLVGSPIVAPSDAGDTCHIAFDSRENLYLHRWDTNEINKVLAPSYSFPPFTLAAFGHSDVEVDRSSDRAYTVAGGLQLRWYESDGTQGPESPVNSGRVGRTYLGVTVNSTTGRIYVTDSNNGTVEIWDLPEVTLTITKTGSGRGTVRSDDLRIDCGSTCSARYILGRASRLTATADAGSTFRGWTVIGLPSSNTCTGTTSPCDVTLSEDVTLVARFDLNQRRVSVRLAGTGSGVVRSSPAGITCGVACTGTFSEGSTVRLTATPSTGSTFAGWTGGGCAGTSTCDLVVPASDVSVTATFTQTPPAATTAAASGVGETSATVAASVNPNGATTSCEFQYGTSTSYGATAPCSPDPGSGTNAIEVRAALSGLAAGTTYHYRVVASNAGGTANGDDMTFATSTPPARTCATDPSLCPPPPLEPGVLKLDSSSATVTGGTAAVKLSCDGRTACTGTLRLTARVRIARRRGRGARASAIRIVVVGTASINIDGGGRETVRVRLTRAGRRLLARTHRLMTTLTAPGLTRQLLLRERASGRRRGRRGRR